MQNTKGNNLVSVFNKYTFLLLGLIPFLISACGTPQTGTVSEDLPTRTASPVPSAIPTIVKTASPTSLPTATQIPTQEPTATPTIEASSTAVPVTSEAVQESLIFVLIEKQEPAYIVYIGISESIEEESLDEIKAIASEEESVQLISWEEFEGIDLASEIILNEYENLEVGKGIVGLIQLYPMTPFGLTWNGGIAFPFNDYQFAEDIYQQYQANSDTYLQTNERDLKEDPINPQNHLGLLLGG